MDNSRKIWKCSSRLASWCILLIYDKFPNPNQFCHQSLIMLITLIVQFCIFKSSFDLLSETFSVQDHPTTGFFERRSGFGIWNAALDNWPLLLPCYQETVLPRHWQPWQFKLTFTDEKNTLENLRKKFSYSEQKGGVWKRLPSRVLPARKPDDSPVITPAQLRRTLGTMMNGGGKLHDP